MLYTLVGNDLGTWEGYYVADLFATPEGNLNTAAYSLLGGVVADGFVAFVPNPNYITQGYTFTGIFYGLFGGPGLSSFSGYGMAWWEWLLLVDPAKDTNAGTAAVAEALSVRPTNCVELSGLELAKKVALETNKPVNRAKVGAYGTMPDLGVARATTTFTEGALPKVKTSGTLKVRDDAKKLSVSVK
jgi:hypothetical protein